MASSLAKMIAENLIVRASLYYPAYSSSVFADFYQPFFLNIVQSPSDRKPILKLYSNSQTDYYLYSPSRHTKAIVKNDTLVGALGGNMRCQQKLEQIVETIITSY